MVREKTHDGQDPIDLLIKVLKGNGKGGMKGVRLEHRIAAAKELLDRGYGKALQQLEHSGDIGTPSPTPGLASFTLEELKQLIVVAEAKGRDEQA